jgi:spermidine synthase
MARGPTAKQHTGGKRTLFEASSPISGRLRVVESRGMRRLVVAGQTLSAYPTSGDWAQLRREYWNLAFERLVLPPRPRVLFVGLGGGTQIHLLCEQVTPSAITAIERDPLIIRVAREWFGLDGAAGIEVICGAAEVVVPRLTASRRFFDLVVEDATYADASEQSLAFYRALVRLVAPGGMLVANRHFRPNAARLAAEMARFFRDVTQRRVRRDGENVVVQCVGRRSRLAAPATA